MRAATLLGLMAASVGCTSTGQSQPAKSDFDRLQGTWQLESGERNGEQVSTDVAKNVTLTFAGSSLKTKKADSVSEATFALHPESNPKGFDLDMDGSPGLGIYKIEGSSLTILHGEVGDPRPANFDAVKGGNLTLLVLEKTSD